MGEDIFLQEYYKIISYFYQIKSIFDFLLTYLKRYYGNLKVFKKKYWTYNYIRQQFCSNFDYYYLLPDIKFDGQCLINNNNTSLSITNLYICYTLYRWSRDLNTDYLLYNWLFGSVRLTKNVALDKYKYNGYIIGFDSSSEFLFIYRNIGKNIVIFAADIAHLCILIIKITIF